MKENKFSKEKEKNIIDLYKQGHNQKDIANLYNTYNTSIRRVLLRNGIKIRSNSEIQSFVPINPFKEDAISDYYLGLLVTDGCISNGKLSISLKKEDKYLLEHFANFLGPKVKVNKYFHKTHSKYQYYVMTRDKKVINHLKTLANFYNKSFSLELYKEINWNIIRGAFDGDGGITYLNNNKSLRWYICGNSKKFLKQIEKFLKKEGFNPTITQQGIWYVNLYKKEEIKKLFELLYKDADIFLKRKYEKLATFVEKSMEKNTLNSGKE